MDALRLAENIGNVTHKTVNKMLVAKYGQDNKGYI